MNIISSHKQADFKVIERGTEFADDGQPRTEYQESFSLIPEHPTNPAMFVVTIVSTWTIPKTLRVTVVAVVTFLYRNENLPPDIEDLKKLAVRAIQIMDKEVNERRMDFDIIHDLFIPPMNLDNVLPMIKGALRNAYPMN